MATTSLSIPQLRLLDTPLWATNCIDQLAYHAYLHDERDFVDSLLEFKFALLLGKSAENILTTFYSAWKRFGDRAYAMFFKLRRWLEQRIIVRCVGPNKDASSSSLKLGYVSVEVLKRSFQNTAFQNDLRCKTLNEVNVSFEWIDR